MPNPSIVACTKDTWVKVATGVASGQVHIIRTVGSSGENLVYLQTYRVTTDPAPTLRSEGVPFYGSVDIESSFDIDVYVMATGAAGSVRVDV